MGSGRDAAVYDIPHVNTEMSVVSLAGRVPYAEYEYDLAAVAHRFVMAQNAATALATVAGRFSSNYFRAIPSSAVFISLARG